MINENDHVITCHGSLITNDAILTAAHCFKDKKSIPKLFVVLGALEPLKEGSPAAESYNKRRKIKSIHEIGKVFLHNEYKLNRKQAYYDLAIVQLKEKLKLNRFLHPLCIPLRPVEPNANNEIERGLQLQTVDVTGYRTEFAETDGQLHFIQPQIQTQAYCNQSFFNTSIVNINDNSVIYEAIPHGFQSSIMCAS